MIAVDTNILVYAHRGEHPWHGPAKAVVTACAEARSPWALPWPCLHEFLAVVTNPKVFRPSTPLDLASAQVEVWLESPSVQVLGESGQHWSSLKDIAGAARILGGAVHDARIVAICIDPYRHSGARRRREPGVHRQASAQPEGWIPGSGFAGPGMTGRAVMRSVYAS